MHALSLSGVWLTFFSLAVTHSTSSSGAWTTILWSVTRAAAVTAYVLLALTTMLGLLRSLGRVLTIRTPWVTLGIEDIHQFAALLTAGFVALHLGSLVLDTYLNFSLINLLVPLGQPYRPFATDLGVIALYALGLVLFTSWLRQRLSYRAWRMLHYGSFVAFACVTAHGLLAGTDASQPWMGAIYSVAVAGVLLLLACHVVWRLVRPREAMPRSISPGLANRPRQAG